MRRIRTRSVESAVHHLCHYITEDLLTVVDVILNCIASTLTPNRS